MKHVMGILNTDTNSFSNSDSDMELRERQRRKRKIKIKKFSENPMNELSYSSLPSSRSRSRSRLDVAAQLNNQRPEHKSEVEQHRIAIQALQQQLAQMEANIRVETDEKQSKNEKTRILEAAQLDNEIQRLKHRIRRENEKEARDKYEANLKAKWEFERAEKAKKLQEEEDIKTELAKEVIRKYEIDLKEKAEQERKRKEQWECEYRAKLQNDLLAAGVDEKDIKAVLDGSKVSTKIAEEEKERKIKLKETQQAALVCVHKQDIPKPYQEIYSHSPQSLSIHEQLLSHHTPLESNQVIRPTYTRMSRRHIEIETLDYYGIKYEFEDDEHVIIKRWIPQWEQESLWDHTKAIREARTQHYKDSKVISTKGDRRHHHHHHLLPEPELQVVRKKSRSRSRGRSKSPSRAVMYIAGIR